MTFIFYGFDLSTNSISPDSETSLEEEVYVLEQEVCCKDWPDETKGKNIIECKITTSSVSHQRAEAECLLKKVFYTSVRSTDNKFEKVTF